MRMTSLPSFEDSSPSSCDDQVEATVPSACVPSVAGAEAWQHVPETLISWSCHADACRGVEVDLPLREKGDKPWRRHVGYEPATAAARVSTGYGFEQGLDQQQLGPHDKQADPRRRRLEAAAVPPRRKVAMPALPVLVAWPRIHVLLLEAVLLPCLAASSPSTSGARL